MVGGAKGDAAQSSHLVIAGAPSLMAAQTTNTSATHSTISTTASVNEAKVASGVPLRLNTKIMCNQDRQVINIDKFGNIVSVTGGTQPAPVNLVNIKTYGKKNAPASTTALTGPTLSMGKVHTIPAAKPTIQTIPNDATNAYVNYKQPRKSPKSTINMSHHPTAVAFLKDNQGQLQAAIQKVVGGTTLPSTRILNSSLASPVKGIQIVTSGSKTTTQLVTTPTSAKGIQLIQPSSTTRNALPQVITAVPSANSMLLSTTTATSGAGKVSVSQNGNIMKIIADKSTTSGALTPGLFMFWFIPSCLVERGAHVCFIRL